MPTAHDIRPTGRVALALPDDAVMLYVECSIAPHVTLPQHRASRPATCSRHSIWRWLLGR